MYRSYDDNLPPGVTDARIEREIEDDEEELEDDDIS